MLKYLSLTILLYYPEFSLISRNQINSCANADSLPSTYLTKTVRTCTCLHPLTLNRLSDIIETSYSVFLYRHILFTPVEFL